MSTASLDAAAAQRKERLSQLKSLKRKTPTAATNTAPPPQDVSHHHLSGRNYDIEDRAPKMGFVSAPSAGQETLETAAAQIAAETRAAAQEDRPIDLFNLQPKKPNWDLKRDVDKKLERLEQRTDMAVARLIKARIEEQRATKEVGGEEEGDAVELNLAAMVKAREKEGGELDGEVEEEEYCEEKEVMGEGAR